MAARTHAARSRLVAAFLCALLAAPASACIAQTTPARLDIERVHARVTGFHTDRGALRFTISEGPGSFRVRVTEPRFDRWASDLVEAWSIDAPLLMSIRDGELVELTAPLSRAAAAPPACTLDEGTDTVMSVSAETPAAGPRPAGDRHVAILFRQHAAQ